LIIVIRRGGSGWSASHPDQDPRRRGRGIHGQGIEQRLRLRLTEDQRRAFIALTNLRDEYESLFRNVIADGMVDGSVRQLQLTTAARTLIGRLNAVDVWYRYPQKNPPAASMASTL
jgi:hypothetical protein